MSETPSALEPFEFKTPALLGALRELVRFAVALEVEDPGSGEWESADQDLVPRVQRIIDGSISLFSQFLIIYEEGVDPEAQGEADQDEKQRLRQQVADQCFIAKMELVHTRASLERIGGADFWAVIACCNQALGSFIKAATALEGVACRIVKQKSLLETLHSAESGVELRRAFYAFRQAIEQDKTPEDDELPARIQYAGDATAVLLHSQIRTRIRLSDRAQLMSLEKRAREWVLLGEKAEPLDGLHLWQDMLALSNLMMQINRREELAIHDRTLISRILERFADPGVPENPAETWRAELKPLLGRDSELDRIIEEPEGSDPQEFQQLLSRTLLELQGWSAEMTSLAIT